MTLPEKLEVLKMDIGITSPAYDTRLTNLLEAAEEQIERMGAHLNFDSAEDDNLVVQYASWMWRKRDSGEDLPRFIQYAINNRIFAEKMKKRM